MPKQQLEGTLEEQKAIVYEMVRERLTEGKYSGAVHYAKEIIKVDPDYRDIQTLYYQAREAKRQQTLTIGFSLLGAIVAVGVTRSLGFTSDWQSLLFAFVGLVIGFLIVNSYFRRSTPSSEH